MSLIENYKKLGTKEFFRRWGEGIQNISPLQQVIFQLVGNILVIIGVIIGLCVTFSTKTWWLFIILLGSLFSVLTSILGTYQKYKMFRKINEQMKGGSYEQESTRT